MQEEKKPRKATLMRKVVAPDIPVSVGDIVPINSRPFKVVYINEGKKRISLEPIGAEAAKAIKEIDEQIRKARIEESKKGKAGAIKPGQ